MPVKSDAALRILWSLVAVALWLVLAAVWLADGDRAAGLGDEVAARLSESGVTNPVTAVLLNFRAMDTLLEIAVLLATLVGVWALQNSFSEEERVYPSLPLVSLLRFSIPALMVIGGYLLWTGASAPGGAFQAGAVLAGAAILLRLSGQLAVSKAPLRWLSAAGLAVFLFAAIATLALGGGLLDYPGSSAGGWILVIETAATVSIAAILTGLFVGGEPGP